MCQPARTTWRSQQPHLCQGIGLQKSQMLVSITIGRYIITSLLLQFFLESKQEMGTDVVLPSRIELSTCSIAVI